MGIAVVLSLAIDNDASLDGLATRRMACLAGLSSRPSCVPLVPVLAAERGTGLSDLVFCCSCNENRVDEFSFNFELMSWLWPLLIGVDGGLERAIVSSESLILGGVVTMDFVVLVVSAWDERSLYWSGINEICRLVFVAVGIEGTFDGTILEDEVDLRREDDGATFPELRESDRLLRRPVRVSDE